MLDQTRQAADATGIAHTAAAMQRSRGRAHVGLIAGPGGRTRLADLHQSGCAKAFLPRIHAPEPEVVLLNTAGGLTGGDRLELSVDLGPRARATATTQTAERAYESLAHAEPACVNLSLTVAPGARLDWLPQETILFEGSALDRRTRIDLGADATILTCETLVLGRAAMGERLERLRLFDRREIYREGRPLVIDPVRLDDSSLRGAHRPAGLAGAVAWSTVIFAGPGVEDALDPARAALAPHLNDRLRAGVSAWDGRLTARVAAADGWPLRRALAALLTTLRGGAALPRVWQI